MNSSDINKLSAGLTALLVFVFTLVLDAQKLTFEGGINASVQGVDMVGAKKEFWGDEFEKSGIVGFSFGPFVRCNFTPGIFGQMEIRYMGKGSEYGYINGLYTQSFERIRFNYVELPLLVGQKGIIHSPTADRPYTLSGGLVIATMFGSSWKHSGPGYGDNNLYFSGFRKYDLSGILKFQMPYRKAKNYELLLGLIMERSLLPIHVKYRLYNFDYGFEICWLFGNQ